MGQPIAMDQAGRIVLPKEVRRRLHLDPGARLMLGVVAQPLTTTKRSRPVARLAPLPAAGALFGAWAGSVREQRDLVAAVDETWQADA